MQEIHSEKCRREAAECRRKAEEAERRDKQAWLKLAEDWGKLALAEDLYQEWRRVRNNTHPVSL